MKSKAKSRLKLVLGSARLDSVGNSGPFTLGEKLYALRTMSREGHPRGYSLDQLCKLAVDHLHPEKKPVFQKAFLSKVERGLSSVQARDLWWLARALGSSPNIMLDPQASPDDAVRLARSGAGLPEQDMPPEIRRLPVELLVAIATMRHEPGDILITLWGYDTGKGYFFRINEHGELVTRGAEKRRAMTGANRGRQVEAA